MTFKRSTRRTTSVAADAGALDVGSEGSLVGTYRATELPDWRVADQLGYASIRASQCDVGNRGSQSGVPEMIGTRPSQK
jgi:hypothetical protein